jgi:hypothetical protein
MPRETKLVRRIELGEEVKCDVILHKDGSVGAHIYPIRVSTFWSRNSTIDLTERELCAILEAVREGKTL